MTDSNGVYEALFAELIFKLDFDLKLKIRIAVFRGSWISLFTIEKIVRKGKNKVIPRRDLEHRC